MSGLRGVILAVRFLCELAMLAALAYWGFTAGDGAGAWLLGVGAPLLAAVVLGVRGSLPRCSTRPRNARRATDRQFPRLGLSVHGASCVLLCSSGQEASPASARLHRWSCPSVGRRTGMFGTGSRDLSSSPRLTW